MSETISGYHGTLQVLNPASPSVTLAGTIKAGAALNGTLNLAVGFGAVYGKTPTPFTILNTGVIIDSYATPVSGADAGIVLGAAGSVTNRGTISAASGGGVYLNHGGAVSNSGTIIGYEQGVFAGSGTADGTYSVSSILNTGLVDAKSRPFTVSGLGGTYLATGLVMFGSGTIDNAAGGSVSATYGDGIWLQAFRMDSLTHAPTIAAGDVVNAGTVRAAWGIEFYGLGTLENSGEVLASQEAAIINAGTALDNSGTLAGAGLGVVGFSALSLSNGGVIEATGTGGVVLTAPGGATPTLAPDGVALLAGGSVTNAAGGIISSARGDGLYLSQAASARNAGRITGYGAGLFAQGAASISNSGAILSNATLLANGNPNFNAGVYLNGGGFFANAVTGTVAGFAGLVGGAATTIDNYGTILGLGGGPGIFFGGAQGSLIEHQGAVVEGGIFDSNADGSLELAPGTALGPAGILSDFSGFPTLSVDAGATWELAGTIDIASGDRFLNNGVLEENAADALTIAAAVAGTGTIMLDSTSLVLGGGVAAGQRISFTGHGDVLELGQAAGFHGTLDGLAQGDAILLTGLTTFSSETLRADTLTITTASGPVILALPGIAESHESLKVVASGGQTTITAVACFVAGTRIRTPRGEVPVEALEIGDAVCTELAGDREIRWIGRRRYAGPVLRGNRDLLPIRIKRHAIADNIPSRDLRVSPGHAISIDSVLIHASRLVNGVSILQEQEVAEVSYFHIELEDHEIIFAENCPAETFMQEAFRTQFENAADFRRLYPGAAAARHACQPQLLHGFHLHAIQRRINARAGIIPSERIGRLRGFVDQASPRLCFGWAQDEAAPEEPVCLDIRSGGKLLGRTLANLYREDVRAAGLGSGYQGFEFSVPPGMTGPLAVLRSADATPLARAGLPGYSAA